MGKITRQELGSSLITELDNSIDNINIIKGSGTLKEKVNKEDFDSHQADYMQENNIKSIMNFLKKLLNKQKVTIARMGDSLVDGAGGTPYWWELLFTEAYRNNGHSLLADFAMPTNYITVDNYALGGTTPDLMLAHFIPQVKCQGNSGGIMTLQVSESLYTNPPILLKQYDLIIFDGGQNGGIYNNVIIEEIARRCIESGSDVIMLSTQRMKNAGSVPTFREYYHNIAAYYGCALIDFDDIYKGDDNFVTAFSQYYYDTIHQSATGHIIYADAFRSIISVANAGKELTPFGKKLPNGRLYWFTDNNRDKQKTYGCYFCNLPNNTTGTTEAAVTGSGIKSPVISQGLTQHTKIDSGQNAMFLFDDAVYLIPIFGGRNLVSSVDYLTNYSGTVQSTRTVDIGYRTASTDFNIDYSVYNSGMGDYPAMRKLRLNVTSGGVYLLGVIVFTEPSVICHKTDLEDFPTGVSFTGTWVESAGYWENSKEKPKKTITDGDEISFTFIGKKIGGSFGISKGGGKIDVYVDGAVIATLDTYANQTNIGYATYQWDCGTYGKHTVKLKLNGVNASAVAPDTTAYPRFAVRRLYLYPDKCDYTEKWNNDKKQASLSI